MDNISLYYLEGSSDKVYQAHIRPHGGGFMVEFAYGRRGATFQAGCKTQAPVNYQTAKGIYDKLVRSKIAKGYTEGERGTEYEHADKTKHPAGILPQLLNPVEEHLVDKLIRDHAYWMQEKKDGRRLMIKKEGGKITGINRLGLIVALPERLITSALGSPDDFIIDGEGIGETLHAFDLLFMGDEDIRGRRYGERYLHLMNLLASFQHPHITLVENQFHPSDKLIHFHQFKEGGKEGVVFKHTDAPYIAGHPASGGPQYKHKFYETASFIVTKLNVRRSVSLILFDGGRVVNAGNVTIPPNTDIPKAGSVIECRYLYAFKESGSIYQPVFLGVREDIRGAECTTAQLKYKGREAA